MKEYFIALLIQLLSTIGIIALGGFLIALCNKLFYANFGNKATVVCYITGALGTPVHELSHALFCLIFGHKITEIKLFQINSEDGTLGYVQHTYNRKNIYQRIGNFFIGIAPIIVISSLLFLVAWALMPTTISLMANNIGTLNLNAGIGSVFRVYFDTMGIYFDAITNYRWWIFILIGAFFALHMNLSGADIKGALSGMLFVLLIYFVVNAILRIISINALNAYTRAILIGGTFLSIFISLALLINIVLLSISFVYRLVRKKLR